MCAATALAACDEEKPYTPFQVATALPEEGPAPTTEKVQAAEKSPMTKWSTPLRAPAGTKSWSTLGRTLSAPAGTEFQVALPLLNSEPKHVVAWVLPTSGAKKGTAEAGVWLFDGAGAPVRLLASLPDYLPQGADCQRTVNLEGTGQLTLTARVQVSCTSRLLPRTPTSALMVLDPSRSDPELVHLRAEDAPVGEKLTLTADSHDHDGDATDDIKIVVSLTAPNGKTESLPFVWLTRTAGASRTPDSPRAELQKRASRLSLASVRKKERAAALEEIDATRRLLSAICSELGTPRIARAGGDALGCGDVQDALEELALAEVTAFVGEKRLEDALGAYTRAGDFGTAFDTAKKKKLAALVQGAIPQRKARRVARFSVKGKTLPSPHASPLFFTDDGQLFAQTAESTKRLTMEGDPPLIVPATDTEPERRVPTPEWPLILEDSQGFFLQGALPSCDRSEVLLALGSHTAGQTHPPIPLPQLAPRPGGCKAFPKPLDAVPLSVDAGALVVAVGGQRVTSRGDVKAPTSPLAWATPLGVAKLRGGDLELYTGPETENLSHCVADQNSREIACLEPSGVRVIAPVE